MSTKNDISGTRALVVDDQKSIRLLLNRILTRHGIEVTECSGGMEALVEIGNGDFDVIFMDLSMPEFSGEDSIRAILEFNPEAKIIVYSALDDPEASKRVTKMGVAAIIQKPATSFEIVEAVKKLLAERSGGTNDES